MPVANHYKRDRKEWQQNNDHRVCQMPYICVPVLGSKKLYSRIFRI